MLTTGTYVGIALVLWLVFGYLEMKKAYAEDGSDVEWTWLTFMTFVYAVFWPAAVPFFLVRWFLQQLVVNLELSRRRAKDRMNTGKGIKL